MRQRAVNSLFPFGVDGTVLLVSGGGAETSAQSAATMTIFTAAIRVHQNTARKVVGESLKKETGNVKTPKRARESGRKWQKEIKLKVSKMGHMRL